MSSIFCIGLGFGLGLGFFLMCWGEGRCYEEVILDRRCEAVVRSLRTEFYALYGGFEREEGGVRGEGCEFEGGGGGHNFFGGVFFERGVRKEG